MRQQKSRRGGIWKRTLLLLAGLMLAGASLLCPAGEARAEEDYQVEVTVGYYGLKDYSKKVVSLTELEKEYGQPRQEIYTWISNGQTCGTTEAEGVYLSDVMEAAGVDVDSVYYYNFFTTDAATYANATHQWTNDQIFAERYSFRSQFEKALADYQESDETDYVRNPERHFTIDNIFDASKTHAYTNTAWNAREPVEPMFALRTKSVSWKNYKPPTDLSFSGLEEHGSPVLLFGQAGKNDITRNLMAQMVYKVHVWFEGSPEITVESQDLDGEIGTEKTLKVKVYTPDPVLTEAIKQELTFESSDESIATVDQSGKVTIRGEGTASISVSYAGTAYGSIRASGKESDQASESGEEGQKGTGSGSGDGTGSGHGSGKGSQAGKAGDSQADQGTGSKAAKTNGKSSIVPASGRRPSLQQRQPAAGRQIAAAENRAGDASAPEAGEKEALAKEDAQTDSVSPRVYEIDPDTPQVLRESLEDNGLLRRVLLAGGLALAAGVLAEWIYYRRQRTWADRAKKLYAKYYGE